MEARTSTAIRVPIRWKLAIAIAIPTIVVAAVVGSINYPRLRQNAHDQALRNAEARADYYASVLEGRLLGAEQAVRTLAAAMSAHPDMTDAEIVSLLRMVVAGDDLIFGSCAAFEPSARGDRRLHAPYVARDGTGFRSMDVVSAYDYTDPKWEWFDTPRRTKEAVWTEPFFDDGAGDIVMSTFSAPFVRDGRFVGVVTCDIPIIELQHRIDLPGSEDATLVIFSRKGTFISHPDPAFVMRENALTLARRLGHKDLEEVVQRAMAGERGRARVLGLRSSDVADLVFYRPIARTGWSFAVLEPESAVVGPLYRKIAIFASVAACGFAGVLLVILMATDRVTRPLRRLHGAVLRLGEGDLGARAEAVDTGDEIGDLARSFNTMVDQLRQHIDALTRESAAREAVESELRIARAIQTSLLPRTFPPFPDRTEFDLHALNAPARFIAGDFFDFFFVDDGRLALVIADVSGKGVPAAMLMAVARTLVRNIARTQDRPGEIMTRANRLLIDDTVDGMFVTMFIALYDTATGELRYANAGHPPPLRLRADGATEAFGWITGPILGVVKDYEAEDKTGRLEPGDRLVLFTDGLTEARSPGGKFFGDQRLAALVSGFKDLSAADMCVEMARAIDEFQEGERHDDATLLVLHRRR